MKNGDMYVVSYGPIPVWMFMGEFPINLFDQGYSVVPYWKKVGDLPKGTVMLLVSEDLYCRVLFRNKIGYVLKEHLRPL